MKAGKLIVQQKRSTSHSYTDENSNFSLKLQKNAERTGGKLKLHETKSTRLQEQSLMNNTYFSAIHKEIHLDTKLIYAISRTSQEMSLSELEALYQLCELERT